MARKKVSPIMTWAFWSILVFGAFLTVTWEFFIVGISADTSKITWIIMVFFVLGMWFSLRAALHLDKEFRALKMMDEEQRIGDANFSDVSALFDAAMERIRRGDRIDARNLVSAYATRLRAQVENVGVIAAMLITSGLLGTVVGLIITISGLDTVLQSNNADFSTMKMGLTRTVSGMGTAFSTTLFGGLLGGVVLKVLGSELKKSVALLAADALRFSELYIAPQAARKASEALVEFEGAVTDIRRHLGTLGESFNGVISTLDSKQTALSTGLEQLVASLESAHLETDRRMEHLVDSVDHRLAESSRLADERLQILTDSIAKSGEDADRRTGALLEAISREIESTHRLADERLQALTASIAKSGEDADRRTGALVEAISQGIEGTHRLADERLRLLSEGLDEAGRKAEERMLAMMERLAALVDDTHSKASERMSLLSDTVARTTEETHRLADERVQTLAAVLDAAASRTHEQSEAHLIRFVDHVDQAIDRSRRHAEHRLNARASDLADKLNEAASALAALASAPSDHSVGSAPESGE